MFQKLNSMFVRDVDRVLHPDPEITENEDEEWIVVDFIAPQKFLVNAKSCDTIYMAMSLLKQRLNQGLPRFTVICPNLRLVNTSTKTPEDTSAFEEIDYVHEDPILDFPPGAFEQVKDTSDSYYVHFDPCPLEESWFVTPPPCFTAGELDTVEVETSPMENLLIEHPSMSVYAVHNLYSKQTIAVDPEIHNSRLDPGHKSVSHHVRCYVATLGARTTLLHPTKTIPLSKLSKQKMEKTVLNRKSLRRQNRIRGCHSRKVKHSRVIVHQPCQRRYNY